MLFPNITMRGRKPLSQNKSSKYFIAQDIEIISDMRA